MSSTKNREGPAAPSHEEGVEEEFRGFYRSIDEIPRATLKFREGSGDGKDVKGKDRELIESLSEESEERRDSRLAFGAAWIKITALSTSHGSFDIKDIYYEANRIAAVWKNNQKED